MINKIYDLQHHLRVKKYKYQKYIRSISLISYTVASHNMLYFCRMTGLKSVQNKVS